MPFIVVSAYTTAEAAAGINEAAGTYVISSNYLHQLRPGTKTEPSHFRLIAIAQLAANGAPGARELGR